MKINRLSTSALLCFLGFICIVFSSVEAELQKQQRANHWVLLNDETAASEEKGKGWDFQLNHSGRYVVQIIFDKDVKFDTESKGAVSVAGTKLTEWFKQNYTFDDQVVFEFKKMISFKGVGQYHLSISSDLPFKQVRVIPHHSNNIGTGKYHEEWLVMHESAEKKAALKWFKEARLGMFIHWGLYSQASGVWKGTKIEDSPYPGPRVAEWLMSTFRIPRAEYKEFAKSFNPDKSFAKNIAQLAKKSGMKYVVITSKHHDGFALFDSKVSTFDVADASPYEGDLIKELYEACLAEGLEFGVYYSHGNDWGEGGDGNVANVKKRHEKLGIHTHLQGKNIWDPSPNSHVEYLEKKAYPQIKELLELLPKLRLIWFDGDGYVTEKQAFDFYKLVYDVNPNVIVNRRVGYQFGDYMDAGDNVIPSADVNLEKHWETCGTANNSWGYKAHDNDWKSPQELLYYFIDIVSKGGNYLLNIGPDGNGDVPSQCVENFHELGEWVTRNKDAIFGTTRWSIPHEGGTEALLSGTGSRAHNGFSREFSKEDFWFSARGDKVYVMSLVNPKSKVRVLSLRASAGEVTSVKLLGSDELLVWGQSEDALQVDLSEINAGKNGYALEVTLKN